MAKPFKWLTINIPLFWQSVAIGALLLFSGSVLAAKLHVVTELSPPYQTLEQNHIGGSATEKVRKFLAMSNLDYEIAMYPWARAMLTVQKSPNTLIYSIAKTPSRINNFHWLIKTYQFKPYLVGRKNQKQLQLTELNDAKLKRIAVQRNDFAHEYLLSHGFSEGDNLIITNSIVESWHLLKNNRVDYIVEEYPAMPVIDVNPNLYTGYLPIKALWQQTYLAAPKSIDKDLLEQLQYNLEKFEKIHK